MSFVDAVRHRLRVFRRGEEYARELDRETRFHLELERLAQSANGRPEHDAELAARRQFGNVTYYREETRRLSLLGSMDRVRQDVAYALRGLRRNSGFTVAVALTLGLGIGVNAAMFSLLERLFVRPAAGIGAPESLRRLYFDPGHSVTNRGSHVFASFNYPSYRALKAAYGNTEVAAYTPSDSVMMVVRADSVPAHVSFVTASYFTALRVRAPLGRTFGPDEDRIETPTPVAIISDALWRSVFRADPRVLGTSPRIDGTRYTIVGVAPREFDGVDLGRVDVWIPLSAMTSNGAPWYLGDANYLRVFVRPSPGERVERLAAIGSLTLRAVHNSMAGRRDTVSKMLMGPIVAALGPEEQDRNVSISAVLAGVSVIVLLIACANVINLMLLRSARRGREIAVRRAIGASALRLFSQFVTESLCLSLLGGAVALMLGLWGSAVLRRLLFPTIHWAAGSVDTRLMALVGAVTVGIAFVAGLAPALHGIPPNLASELRGGDGARSHRAGLIRPGLLALQAGLSVVLLIGAGLFMRTLDNIESIDVGYDTHAVLLVTPRGAELDQTAAARFEQAAAALERISGVSSVAFTSVTPMRGYSTRGIYRTPVDSILRFGREFPSMIGVSPGYFQTAGVRVLAGRSFNDADVDGSAPVMIVSRAMAALTWPGESALGKCLIVGVRTSPCRAVVGVAGDVHRSTILEGRTLQYYLPLRQSATTAGLLVRLDPARLGLIETQIRSALSGAIPPRATLWMKTLDEVLDPELRPWRLGAILFGGLSILALVVAAIGVYSVIAYAASQRLHEMGIRIALGAQVADLLDLIVAGGLRTLVLGILGGLVAAVALGRLVASMLFGVTTHDPAVLIGAATALLALGSTSCVIAGWRAAHVDPAATLRSD